MRLCVLTALAMATICLPSYAQYQNGCMKAGFRFPLDHRWTAVGEAVVGVDQGALSNVNGGLQVGIELNVLKTASVWFDARMAMSKYSGMENRDNEYAFQQGIVWRSHFINYGFQVEERLLRFEPSGVDVSCTRAAVFAVGNIALRDSLFAVRVAARAVINMSSEVYDSEVFQRVIFSAGLFRTVGARLRLGAQYEVHLFGKNQPYFSDRHGLHSLCVKIEYCHNKLLIRRFRHD